MKLWKQGIVVISKDKICSNCGNQVGLPIVCSYCYKIFCEDCRLPETHNCKNFNPRKAIPQWKKSQ